MHTLHKLLKITGAICLSCICLTSEANPKIRTLEEIHELLDRQCEEGQKTLQEIEKKIEEGNQKGFAPTYNETGNCYSYSIPKEFSENFKGITRVEYNADGEPVVIETVNLAVLDALQFIPCEDTPFVQYIGKRFSGKTSTECLGRISKELAAKELKTRGITDTDTERYEIASVREITFDSILSGFFNKEEADKARVWFLNSEELNKAIDAYVNKAMFLRIVTYRRKDACIDWVVETSPNDLAFKIRKKAQQPNEYEPGFVYEVSGERRKMMKQILADGLKDLLRYKNGKEKVILLLLLDEKKTPSEFQLKWVWENDNYGEYNVHGNWIVSDFGTNEFKFLSHEIGHYLQTHLGLHQDLKTNDEFREAFEGYQTKFARKLLLTEPTEPKTNKEVKVPCSISSDVAVFYGNPHLSDPSICFSQFSEKALFAHWQLISRWDNCSEISNILGIYFSSAKTVCVCALSDIRELNSVRYGHDPRNVHYGYLKNSNGEYWEKFETPELQTVFENIVTEAAGQRPLIDALRFLCKLHKRSDDSESEIVNLFDYDSKEDFLKHGFSYLQDFKTADE